MNSPLLGIILVVGGLGLVSGRVAVLMKRVPLSSAEKGLKFEHWVAKRFRRDYFSIKEWRSDKFVDGIYAESATHPDCEVEFHMKGVRKQFAVECKWRQDYNQAPKLSIEWASDRQINNYRQFGRAKDVPVFVIIGIGGEPDNPADVYIVNLERLPYSNASAEYLEQFRRKQSDKNLYYDYELSELR